MRSYLLDEVIGKSDLPEAVRTSIRTVLGSCEEYRKHVPYTEADESNNLFWRAG